MRTVSAREANQQFARILGEAANGEEIVITRRGKPVAVLAPYRQPSAHAGAESGDRGVGPDDAAGPGPRRTAVHA